MEICYKKKQRASFKASNLVGGEGHVGRVSGTGALLYASQGRALKDCQMWKIDFTHCNTVYLTLKKKAKPSTEI